jgi:hypothetical protein
MTNRELRQALLNKLGSSRQALSQRVKRLKSKYGPMSTEEGVYLLAHMCEIDITRYLDPEMVQRIRQLVEHVALVDQPVEQKKARSVTLKTVRVSVGGEFELTDPLLPERILREAKEMANIYAELYVFENSVRDVVLRVMSRAYGKAWWDSHVPTSVQRTVKSRQEREGKNAWHGKRGLHPIYYTDIPDLVSIIKANWTQFKSLFPNQEWVSVRISEIAMSRNVIDHHNPLGKADLNRVKGYFGDWQRQIDSVKDQLT